MWLPKLSQPYVPYLYIVPLKPSAVSSSTTPSRPLVNHLRPNSLKSTAGMISLGLPTGFQRLKAELVGQSQNRPQLRQEVIDLLLWLMDRVIRRQAASEGSRPLPIRSEIPFWAGVPRFFLVQPSQTKDHMWRVGMTLLGLPTGSPRLKEVLRR
jgi:hypothetical protein